MTKITLAAIVVGCALCGCSDPASPGPPAASPPAPTSTKPIRKYGRGEISSIGIEEFFALQQSSQALIFDARPAFLYHLGHVPGATHLSKDRCDEAITARKSEIEAALAQGRSLVVYCSNRTCPDARTVAIHLSGFGYPAKIFSGGWNEWREAGMPAD